MLGDTGYLENKGQIKNQNGLSRPDVLFSFTNSYGNSFIRNNGISYQLYNVITFDTIRYPDNDNKELPANIVPKTISIYRVDVNWQGINNNFQINKESGSSYFYNYIIENNYITNVKKYEKVILKNVYNNIDIKYYSQNDNLKYDFIVHPGGNYKNIKLKINGASLSLDSLGNLKITTPLGDITESKPIVFQGTDTLAAQWIIKQGGNVEIKILSPINYSQDIIIDPLTRLWGSYFGDSQNDGIYDMTKDNSGNIYHCGYTLSTNNIATAGAFQTTYNGNQDGFVAKFNSAGTKQWGTYIGSSGANESAYSLIYYNNKVYATGITSGALPAFSGTYQGGGGDAFIVSLDQSNGSLIKGRYYGGAQYDQGNGICEDKISNNIYVCGQTQSSSGIATIGAHQTAFGGNTDAFLVKLDANNLNVIWGTYYGGPIINQNDISGEDIAHSCITDNSGNIYLCGHTSSDSGISTTGAFQATRSYTAATERDAFVAKFNSAGTRQWGTYYGIKSSYDDFYAITTDPSIGDIYLGGHTQAVSPNALITSTAWQSTNGGAYDGLLVKFDNTGNRIWGSYYGGNASDFIKDIAFDNNSLYFCGFTQSPNNISSTGAYQSNLSGNTDAFLANINTLGTSRNWGTYYGGTADDYGNAITINCSNIYMAGETKSSTNIATLNSFNGASDGFVVKFDDTGIAQNNISITSAPTGTVCVGNSFTLTATGANSYTWQPSGQATSSIVVTPPYGTSIYTVFGTVNGTCIYSAAITVTTEVCCPNIPKGAITVANCTLIPFMFPLPPNSISWSSMSSGGVYSNVNIVVPITGIISGNYVFSGTILVQTPITFNNTEIFYTEAAMLSQNINAPVNILNSYWHACDKNWFGIWSFDKLTIRNSVIEDAVSAVFISPVPLLPPPSITHKGLIVDNVIFNKNLTGININNARLIQYQVTDAIFTSRQLPTPYTFGSGLWTWSGIPAYNPVNYYSYPTANLLGSAVLGVPSSLRGQVGIHLSNVVRFPLNNQITIGQFSFSNTKTNFFDNMKLGIHAENNTKVEIINSKFQYISYNPALDNANLTGGIYANRSVLLSGTPLTIGYSNTFTKCDVGIVNTNNGAFTIQKNQFLSCGHGIEAILWGGSVTNTHLVQNNDFQNCFIDVYCWENKSIQMKVNNNTSNYSTPPGIVKGAFVCNVYLAESAISPLVQYTVAGNTFNGKHNASVYAINQNTINVSSNNLSIVPPSTIGKIYNAPIWFDNVNASFVENNDISCIPSAANEWNSFGVFNNIGQNNTFCGNTIHDVGVCLKVQGNCPSNIWANNFSPNPASPSLLGIHIAHYGYVADVAYTVVATNQPAGNTFGYFSNADTYSSNFSTGSFIFYDPLPFGNHYQPILNGIDPFSSPSTPFIPLSNNLGNTIASCTNLPTLRISPGIPKVINNQIYLGTHLPVARRGIYQFLRTNKINPAAVNGNTFAAVQKLGANEQWIGADSLITRYRTLQDTASLLAANSKIQSAAPADKPDSVAMQFYQLYYQYTSAGTLSANDVQKLQVIAGLCPFTDGLAVYQARALLVAFDTTVFYNGCEVNLVAFPARTSKPKDNVTVVNNVDILVFPNPTSDFITVSSNDIEAVIEIEDVSGKVVLREDLMKSPRVIWFHNLTNGLYVYKVYKKDCLLKTGKIILEK